MELSWNFMSYFLWEPCIIWWGREIACAECILWSFWINKLSLCYSEYSGLMKDFFFFILVLQPIKIISLILSPINHKMGRLQKDLLGDVNNVAIIIAVHEQNIIPSLVWVPYFHPHPHPLLSINIWQTNLPMHPQHTLLPTPTQASQNRLIEKGLFPDQGVREIGGKGSVNFSLSIRVM